MEAAVDQRQQVSLDPLDRERNLIKVSKARLRNQAAFRYQAGIFRQQRTLLGAQWNAKYKYDQDTRKGQSSVTTSHNYSTPNS